MNDILISIIIPVFNGEKYLNEAIDSALLQTYSNVEIIVVNDGSNDNTEKIALSYGNKIKYFKKQNGGVSTALNLGIEKMNGEYFSWLSHDDIYYPNKIEEQVKFLNQCNNKKIILYTDYEIIDNESNFIADVILNHEELNNKKEYGLLRCKINGVSLLIPKKAFEEAGLFNTELRCTQDYEKWWDMINVGYDFIHYPKKLVKTRIHNEQVTNTSPNMVKEGDDLWIKLIDYPSKRVKKKLEGTEYMYYLKAYDFLNTTPYKGAITHCENRLKELTPKNNLISRGYMFYKKNGIKSFFRKMHNKFINLNKMNEQETPQDILNELNAKIEDCKSDFNEKIANLSIQNELNINNLYKNFKHLSLKIYENITYLTIDHYEKSLQKKLSEQNYKPLVTIVIPVYNGANFLREAIDSALNQNYKNIEIIIVNDGSIDNGKTEDIALSYGDKIKYFKKENGGVSSALNYGIEHMKGDYFAWLSHDDLFKQDHIEKHIEYLQSNLDKKVITYTSLEIIDNNGNLNHNATIQYGLFAYNYFLSLDKPEYGLLMGEINGDSTLIPKIAFNEVGLFNENLRITQERDMWERLMQKYIFVPIPYITTSLRVHDNQVSNTAHNVMEKSNTKQKEIIYNIPIEKVLELEGNINHFYTKLKSHYDLNGRTEIADFIDNLIKENIENSDGEL